MDLTQNGHVLTGTWTERTSPGGYYQGAVYHGAIQLLLEPSGRRMAGKWAGFGREWDVTPARGRWSWSTADTGPAAVEQYKGHPILHRSNLIAVPAVPAVRYCYGTYR